MVVKIKNSSARPFLDQLNSTTSREESSAINGRGISLHSSGYAENAYDEPDADYYDREKNIPVSYSKISYVGALNNNEKSFGCV